MKWPRSELVRDFFRLDEEEAVGCFEELPIFLKPLQPHGRFAFALDLLDPIRAESPEIFRQSSSYASVGRDDAKATLVQNIVIGDREKVVAVCFVPIDDHLGKVITIAPK